ncbi:MAG: efflux RND transporter periplasmic adaptor subunit [Planctomycetes bacterium]|nr:efflux RND transporter periplasmic adaptor subunit [Planctomycetota bacterium]
MSEPRPSPLGVTLAAIGLLVAVGGTAAGLFFLKQRQEHAAAAAAEATPEFSATVECAEVRVAPYTKTTTAIGTARALRSITLRNELPGTVHAAELTTGKLVEKGDLLVELDVAVEQAQLAALEAESRLAETMLGRMERALEQQGASAADVDRARAQRDMAVANVSRLEAIIEQKRLRAPFRARVGLVDLHLGQYLEPGTQITTLQGIDDAVHIDFPVTQDIARTLSVGLPIDVVIAPGVPTTKATVTALDARVDTNTRNTWIRAELRADALPNGQPLPAPGASVRVKVPVAPEREVKLIPVSALRRGPDGSSVWTLVQQKGQWRAMPRPVVSGTAIGDEIVVESGLEAGEKVAAEGSFKIKYPGMLILLSGAPGQGGADGAAPAAAPHGEASTDNGAQVADEQHKGN